MTARILDGTGIARRLRETLKNEGAALKVQRGITPGLAVVLVGNNPASEVYVRAKGVAYAEAGFLSWTHRLPSEASQGQVLDLIAALNADPEVHGILVQMPLPSGLDSEAILEAVAPTKDVDGFHPFNIGRLVTGRPGPVPCTPQGCLHLIKEALPEPNALRGLQAVVVGRSTIVGKPVAHLLLREDCTVTLAHSRTRDLPEVCARADVLIAAVGRPGLIRGTWIKPGAVVMDVGITRTTDAEGTSVLKGDVAFDEAVERAGALTPVPGGVGPMTIAYLLKNTLEAARNQGETR